MERRVIDVAAGREPADLVLRGGRIVNVVTGEIERGDLAIAGERIAGIGQYDGREIVELEGRLVCPGFIDGHVHIESSLLSVPEFTRTVAARGTIAVVTDPHEIANVMGTEGIRYMLTSSKYCPVRVHVMLSSCVPASPLETAGAELDAEDLEPLLADPWVLGLAEMMNYPGVVAAEEGVLAKLAAARGRIVDGHAPGLTGRPLQAYIAAGIGSDHECTTLDEAREKLRHGLYIMIREGSQARNLEALLPLVTDRTADRFMFVTDDKDIEDLLAEGHIDHIVRKATALGLDFPIAVRLASLNPARYFNLRGLGAVAPGYQASIAVIDDETSCRVSRVYQSGRLIARDGVCLDSLNAPRKPTVLRSTINVHRLEPGHFAVRAATAGPALHAEPSKAADPGQSAGQATGLEPARFAAQATGTAGGQRVHVIEMIEDQLVTGRRIEILPVIDGAVQPDPGRDIAKIAVIERHQASGRIGVGFIRGLGLRDGAIGSTVAHDAHNIVVAATNDRDLYEAAVHLVRLRGGLCAVRGGQVLADMPLPIAGLMSDAPAAEAAAQLRAVHGAAAEVGCRLRKPFMGLSFMSLSVIGSLKLTDQGLIDVDRFQVMDLLVNETH